MASKQSIPFFDVFLGLLELLFKDGATGRVLFSRVFVVVLLALLAFAGYKSDSLITAYVDSTYDKYDKLVQKDRDSRFDNTALEQLQIVHISSGADFSAVFTFRPKNLYYFVDLIAYEGTLPSTVDSKNLGGYPIDKTTAEYSTHLSGRYFWTDKEFVFLPTKRKPPEISYMFSCPYFNLDNVYAGTVEMYWYNSKPALSNERLTSICGQAVRALGRAK